MRRYFLKEADVKGLCNCQQRPSGVQRSDRERIVPIQPDLAAWLEQVPEAMRTGQILHSRKFFERAVEDARIGLGSKMF